MNKTYLVAGANWIAEVNLTDVEHFNQNEIQLEACTQAVERHLGKRTDIPYYKHNPLTLTEEQRNADELHSALIDLLTEELEKGCGIGMLLCVMDNQDPATYADNEEHEWYVNSKMILENVGAPSLVKTFDNKYPDKKKKKKTK